MIYNKFLETCTLREDKNVYDYIEFRETAKYYRIDDFNP